EIFLKMAKEGSTVSGLMDTFATTVSVALQYGVPLKDLVNKFAHVRFEPSGFTGNSEIPIAKSLVDYIFRWLGSRFLSDDDKANLGLIDRSSYEAQPAFGSGGTPGLLVGASPAPLDGLGDRAPAPPAAAGSPATEPQSGSTSGRAATSDDQPKASAVATDIGAAEGAPAEFKVIASNGHVANGNGKSGNGNGGGVSLVLGNVKVAFATQGDAPSCMDCGAIMVRNGSCYKCLNCGSTSGCS
ncbi:MAG: vitamin B12-dependent ribonucleotide reductase, partial [Chloroflexota bacterium]